MHRKAEPSMPGNLAKFERTVRDGKSQTWRFTYVLRQISIRNRKIGRMMRKIASGIAS